MELALVRLMMARDNQASSENPSHLARVVYSECQGPQGSSKAWARLDTLHCNCCHLFFFVSSVFFILFVQ